jgi:hypothetical protein
MKGIQYEMFKYGIPEMLFEHQDVIDRILDGVKHEEKGTLPDEDVPELQEPLTVEDFMKCTSFIIATTFVDKIDLFFKMIDSDGNGLLSWEEVNEICLSCLQIFNVDDDNTDFTDNLSYFFTDYIFELCGYDTMVFKNKGNREEDHSSFLNSKRSES